MASNSASPDDSYFNDLNQTHSNGSGSNGLPEPSPELDNVPRPKRIACVVCRKRKLRCDGSKPSCGTCARLGHDCAYDEVRRKSGPKRGYVKALEARLAQVETLLKTQDPEPMVSTRASPGYTDASPIANINAFDFTVQGDSASNGQMGGQETTMGNTLNMNEGFGASARDQQLPMNLDVGMEDFSWEMIGLGLEEPLPSQEVVDELTKIYFEKIHPSSPMIHRPRYYAAMNLAPNMRPPICLRYAMWCLASSVTEKYIGLQEHFYHRARKYAELDELKGHGETMASIAHSQAWTLMATYEFKMMYFPRAWMSSGRASRLALMLGLHRLDGAGLDVKQCLPPPKDWTEREERRRTFWMAFCNDRYASIGTGWPMMIEEKDILTNLPSSDDSYLRSKSVTTQSLKDALFPSGASKLSSFAGVVLMACLFGRNLIHLHRPDVDDRDDDLNGEFWKRHRQMDNILLNTALSLPSHLKLPNGLSDPNIVFLNMNIHTSTICLHQAAIFKADKNHMPSNVSSDSKIRCLTASAEIASVMRMVSHLDLSSMNPFISFSLYVAARVFVQYLKSRPEDEQVKSSLQFLLSAMNALKSKNPLTESFLVQLDVDLEGAGLIDPQTSAQYKLNLDTLAKSGIAQTVASGNVKCSPLFEIRQSQGQQPPQAKEFTPQDPTPSPIDNPRRPSYNPPAFAENYNDLPARMRTNFDQMTQPTSAHAISSLIPPTILPSSRFADSPVSRDMDLSPDDSADHATPSTHSTSSAGRTYTPPHEPPLRHGSSYTSTASSDAAAATPSIYFPAPTPFMPLRPAVQSPPTALPSGYLPTEGKEAFTIPNWDFEDGMAGQEMPIGEGMFSHLMELGLAWDGSPAGQEMEGQRAVGL
ncbi:MAG: hypothetical protein M1829_000136 [Trizodia sp. TS-e1964]|nr:MAG: hypothetical protein M1829_000136 [Trizodia sp. TS-e1964]